MAHPSKRFSALQVKRLTKPGRYADGGGLYLSIAAGGTKSWVFLWQRDGRRREMGLGPYPAVSLADAREKADEVRRMVASGGDPIAARRREAEPTFGECAEMVIASMQPGWRSKKHLDQWRSSIRLYCGPIAGKRVSAIDTADVLMILSPIWATKPETASRLRGRIETVLDFARARGWRTGENPAVWRGNLKSLLPARRKLTKGHHAAMDYRDVPAFIARLRGEGGLSAMALEFAILTAGRSGEVLGARWDEMDFEQAIWTVPGSRMKAGRRHRVPLSPRAMQIVQELAEIRFNDFVFPGWRRGRPLSPMPLVSLMGRLGAGQFTIHGFRSSFRDWAGDCSDAPRELAEGALGHIVGSDVERSYRRGDALEKRRALMVEWCRFIGSTEKITEKDASGPRQTQKRLKAR